MIIHSADNLKIRLPVPRRIVSLVPSQTELLYDLGFDEEIVGITKYCVIPRDKYHRKTWVGGTKQIKADIVRDLRPDLILGNKEENVKEQIEALEDIAPIYISDVGNLQDALVMISDVGLITGKFPQAQEIISDIRERFRELDHAIHGGPAPNHGVKLAAMEAEAPIPTAYFIWRNPWMSLGGDTFINDMMSRAGFENVFRDKTRYPTITPEDLAASGAKLILLSSEPFPFKESHMAEFQEALPGVRVLLVDGEMFSWYGSRLLHSPGYFLTLRSKVAPA
jgi:ABC-type Fe3+-hydroxamate transport system substrate-binding protein